MQCPSCDGTHLIERIARSPAYGFRVLWRECTACGHRGPAPAETLAVETSREPDAWLATMHAAHVAEEAA